MMSKLSGVAKTARRAAIQARLRGTYLHGSSKPLKTGLNISGGRNSGGKEFKATNKTLNKHRPFGAKKYQNHVFMADDLDALDYLAPSTEYIYHVKPHGRVRKVDGAWWDEVDRAKRYEKNLRDMVKRGEGDRKKLRAAILEYRADANRAAKQYWRGKPHPDYPPSWEYMARGARVIKELE